jgi:hypothetical protein
MIKQHITYMNTSRYANIDKFVNIRYIFLLARRAYSWLFQLAQMWKLLAPGVGLVDFLTPVLFCWKYTITNDQTPIKYFKGELKHVLQKGIDSFIYS